MDRPCGNFDQTYKEDMAIIHTRTQWAWLAALLLILFTLPLYADVRIVALANLVGITVVAVHGLNILTGMAGQISMGQAALMAVGGYTSALLTIHFGVPFWANFIIAPIVTGAVGLIFGLPSLRLKGFYLAMSTMAAQFIIPWIVVNVRPDITGGTSALVVPAPRIGDFVFSSQQSMFYIIIPVTLIITLLVRNLIRTKIGRAFVAVRDNDLAAQIMGVDVFYYKMLAFFICSMLAGLAGSMWAYWMRAVAPDHFTLDQSIWFLGIIVIGGMGSSAGAIIGTILVRSLDLLARILGPVIGDIFPSFASSIVAGLGSVLFGLIVLIFLIFEPRGLHHRWETIKNSYRLWPFSY